MRLWVISDLHLSRVAAQTGVQPPVVDADVAVVAGDITEGVGFALTWLWLTITRRMPVIWVAGNHEYFGEVLPSARVQVWRHAAHVGNLHLLDDSSVILGGVRFLGATLWTDYRLHAHGERARQEGSMRVAERMPDHGQILMEAPQPGTIARRFSPADALDLHEVSVAWLRDAFEVEHDGPTVVVTHHAPHPLSVAERWRGHPSTPSYVSDLSSLIDRGQPRLWVHGHTHASFDYEIKPMFGGLRNTRIVCNARGYSGENPAFDWGLVIDV
ncbi:metallophosphoesterase [Chenggangzhangella methanolivorans]|uniref:Metallophosphoesterase n=1 Tax=Chenggangzhangella methanolivorans TaxID=1437009 RepID=A0A9E6UN37_9HYPH|nr:metallophosphoesterase [Chenggangzhangella methanolivorans]QZO00631.1 metallophosphoesterase [Chenggangzhangella methanolivorans]